jgi:transposase InsO family protein
MFDISPTCASISYLGIFLIKKGMKVTLAKEFGSSPRDSLVVAKGKSCCSLYKTHMKVHRDELFAVEDSSSPNLWHKRLGHMSEKGLQILAKKSLIPVDKGKALTPCEHCLFGKQHRVSFATSSQKKSTILERVYSDVCGPIEVPTLGGNRYFVTFVDDASMKVWVYLLKTKDQVFDIFQQFHAMVEREIVKQLKCLRIDNGGEYTVKKFRSFCSEHGIRHEKTMPGTP